MLAVDCGHQMPLQNSARVLASLKARAPVDEALSVFHHIRIFCNFLTCMLWYLHDASSPRISPSWLRPKKTMLC